MSCSYGLRRNAYGSQLLEQLSLQLSREFGRGFDARNLRRMVQFALAFPQREIGATLSRQVSWSHLVRDLYATGNACGEMLVLRADTETRDLRACFLAQRKLPVENRLGSGDFDPISNKINAMTMRVSKGLEFPVVALPGVRHMPAPGGAREGSGAGVLCGGDSDNAEVGSCLSRNGAFGQIFSK
ncbi:DUF1016 N-terminal domain-containing protein [Acidovorax sp. 106]|uniref:DUF1016 N-terminal domain-containing protein n=1 Tax=Acidovorax sp. 106 TaxID=2135637 RepID=UPI0018F57F97|nr:DUF1016 N-terminal domain-containing protein [Acidovorax sp. 106]